MRSRRAEHFILGSRIPEELLTGGQTAWSDHW